MKVAAIIAEYNPFHNGHKYQIDRIRETLGKDCAVIAIMSGNYTQRGELAITDKAFRAEAACNCGVNLVLELPFPFSMSSAEFFATAGVRIANSLGIVDYLVFGSESGNIDELADIAEISLSEEFLLTVEDMSGSDDYKSKGYPEICEAAIKRLYGKEFSSNFFSPNNILAIEYIKAIRREKSNIIPVTFSRVGAGYNDSLKENTPFQSASGIRADFLSNGVSALDYVPFSARSIFLTAEKEGKFPSDATILDTAVIAHFRLNSPARCDDIHDAAGGLYNRLCDISAKVSSISSLTSKTETKKYTKARIRRAIWNSYFGVTSSDVRANPAYTQVLAMDDIGKSLLKSIKKTANIAVITKPSSYIEYGDEVIRQAERSHKADSVYGLTLKVPNLGTSSLTFTPYVKK